MLPVLGLPELPFEFYIGAYFTKEQSTLYPIGTPESVFTFVLDGSFEVEGRLLFAGDALAMKEKLSLDIECLSATGLILTFTF